MTPAPLTPRQKILVVEDHWLVAMQAKHILEQLGCEVLGPFGTVTDAMPSARDADLQGAILDVNLGEETSLAVAEMLRDRDIPFALATGYYAEHLPEGFRSGAHLDKPYSAAMVQRFLATIGLAGR